MHTIYRNARPALKFALLRGIFSVWSIRHNASSPVHCVCLCMCGGGARACESKNFCHFTICRMVDLFGLAASAIHFVTDVQSFRLVKSAGAEHAFTFRIHKTSRLKYLVLTIALAARYALHLRAGCKKSHLALNMAGTLLSVCVCVFLIIFLSRLLCVIIMLI